MTQIVNVIGAGLAGSEAAWKIANAGFQVHLYEMKPVKFSDAHKSEGFAELVCSNSFRSNQLVSGVGVLKAEMRKLQSIIIEAAEQVTVPAGSALAVDRDAFSAIVTDKIKNHPNITIIAEVIEQIPEGPTLIATGPLTDEALSKDIGKYFGEDYLYFYDAAAPIIEKDSIDFSKAFFKSRYEKGDADYINCPMNEEEYNIFYDALVNAEAVPLRSFEDEKFFEGCMPIEVMAARGPKTMLFGPLKPVGLRHPVTEQSYHAVVQLRQDNLAATLYNVVGFQTHLKWPEQKRVLQLIPGLENCEIVRYGVMHRNTFINSPKVLKSTYQTEKREDLFFAGQMTGVEGYVESAASGIVAGMNMVAYLKGEAPVIFPLDTMIGAQANYIANAEDGHFQPMNANFGLLPQFPGRTKKSERKQMYADRALESMDTYLANKE